MKSVIFQSRYTPHTKIGCQKIKIIPQIQLRILLPQVFFVNQITTIQ